MLSDSYVMDVSYTQGDQDFTVESWFVKVPKTLSTFTLGTFPTSKELYRTSTSISTARLGSSVL